MYKCQYCGGYVEELGDLPNYDNRCTCGCPSCKEKDARIKELEGALEFAIESCKKELVPCEDWLAEAKQALKGKE